MDGRELLKKRAGDVLNCLLPDDQEVVRAWIEQEKMDAAEGGRDRDLWMGYVGAAIVVCVILSPVIFLTWTFVSGRATESVEVRAEYAALREACIERVLCTCKDLPPEEP